MKNSKVAIGGHKQPGGGAFILPSRNLSSFSTNVVAFTHPAVRDTPVRDLSTDMHVDARVDMRVDMREDMCVDMCIDLCIGMVWAYAFTYVQTCM